MIWPLSWIIQTYKHLRHLPVICTLARTTRRVLSHGGVLSENINSRLCYIVEQHRHLLQTRHSATVMTAESEFHSHSFASELHVGIVFIIWNRRSSISQFFFSVVLLLNTPDSFWHFFIPMLCETINQTHVIQSIQSSLLSFVAFKQF